MGIGDWGLVIGDWAQSPIPIMIKKFLIKIIYYYNFHLNKNNSFFIKIF
jgi:hypothetical protein